MDLSIEKIVGPVQELNELTMKNIEKITAIQVKAMQENAQASMEALQASSQIKDLDSLNLYMQSQMGLAQKMYSNAVKDAEKIAKMSEAYANSVKDLVEKSISG